MKVLAELGEEVRATKAAVEEKQGSFDTARDALQAVKDDMSVCEQEVGTLARRFKLENRVRLRSSDGKEGREVCQDGRKARAQSQEHREF